MQRTTRLSTQQTQQSNSFGVFSTALSNWVTDRADRASVDPAEYARVQNHVQCVESLCAYLAKHRFSSTSVIKEFQLPAVQRVAQTDSWKKVSKRVAAWMPCLYQGPPMDHLVIWEGYAAQQGLRDTGLSWARYQHADAGTFTEPHIDHDDLYRPVHSCLQQLVGHCIVLAWHRSELSESDLVPDPSMWYEQLKELRSFSCAIMHGACAISMRADTVHMVFTAQYKEQFAFHMYPN